MTDLFYAVSAVLAAMTFPFVVDSWRRFGTGYLRNMTLAVGFVYLCGFAYSIAPFLTADMNTHDLVGRVCVSLFFVGIVYMNYLLNRASRLFGFKEIGRRILERK